MEFSWTKKKLCSLVQGDGETVRQWQSQYGRYIYTLLYYQLDKDESQAAAQTAQILSHILREISVFDPEQTAMYLWLKDNALRQFQAELDQLGMKSQRPWAWSEIPAQVLDSLKRIRSEVLVPEVSGCGAVVEMVQAALAELSEQDRTLVLRRYTRLDTVEQIATEFNLPIEKVNQQLYLARHAFRRGLFFMIQSANPDFVEPTVTGALELFEGNLETLLRSVNASATMSSNSAELIKRAVLQTASEIAQNPPAPAVAASGPKMRQTVLAVAVVLIAAALFLGWFYGLLPSKHPEATPPPVVTEPEPVVPERQRTPIDQEELKRVMDMGVRGDVAGLLEILKTGSFVSQISAAHFLGQFGGDSAISPLLESMAWWYPDQPQGNPFSIAVEQILDRLVAVEPVETLIAEPVVEETSEPAPEEIEDGVRQPLLAGQVAGFDGVALAGVQISLHRDDAARGQTTPISGYSATTDPEGRYAFETLPEGRFIVVVRDPQERIAEMRRMVWRENDTPVLLDFAGSAFVLGVVLIDDTPPAGQTLLLSDALNTPTQGVFTAGVKIDDEGEFVFNGVPSGLYGLFAQLSGNLWTLLGQVVVDTADIQLVLDLARTTLIVQAEGLPEGLGMLAASLRYGPDSSDVLAEWKGVRTEVETNFEIKGVIEGSYTLCVDFSNGVRTLHDVVISGPAEQVFVIDSVPFGTAGMEGRFLSDWPEGLTLEGVNPPMRVSVMPEEDGFYALGGLTAGMYSLGTTVNGIFVPYLEVGLFEEQPIAFDPDPVQMAQSRSPLYIYVTDGQGLGLAGGQVWLAGDGGFYVAEPFGRGYFAAVAPGNYALAAAFAGCVMVEQPISVPLSTVKAPPSEANTRVIRLSH